MTHPDQLLHRQLLFIVHRGLIEARMLAGGQKHQQIFDLADALENIPALLLRWEDSFLTGIVRELETYERKYPHAFNYSSVFKWEEIPDDIG